MPVPVIDTSHPHADSGSAVMAIVPSTKRTMARQSSASLVQSQRLSSSTDSLIDSLVSPAPSPTKKGKAKAQDHPQPVASSSDAQPESILPNYLVPNSNPGKRESVDSAMRRTETNFTILASKLDVAQTTISDDIKGLRAHLTQLASDYTASNGPKSSGDHTTLSELITSHNRVVEAVTELKDLAVSLNANNTALTHRFATVESAVAALQQGPNLVPAEKRARYENMPTSTLVQAAPTHFEYPHIHSPYSNDTSPSYTSNAAIPNAPVPLQNAVSPQYTGHAATPNPPTPYNNTPNPTVPLQNAVAPQYTGHAAIPNAPTPYNNTFNSNRSRAILIGPMNWRNPRDEVVALMNMLPTLNSLVKQNFNVGSTNNIHFVKILFGSPSDATAFARVWSNSRPQQYKGVTAKYVPEN
jgi:hypothetical protein